MVNMLIGLFVLGILVFIHELGHFLAAKFCKIPVITFSIGFGKRIFYKKVGETTYQIAAIPFGGYCALEGEHPKNEEELTENSFDKRPIWQRALVVIAGPVFNIITAYIFLAIMYMNGVPHAPYLDTNVVGFVSEESPAFGKVKVNDKIISINGKEILDWQNIHEKFSDLSKEHSVLLKRGNDTVLALFNIPFPDPRSLEGKGSGIYPPIPPVVGMVEPHSVAEAAGLLSGDSIIYINDMEISCWQMVSEAIGKYDASFGAISVVVFRSGDIIDLSVIPKYSDENKRYLIGISMANPSASIKKYSFEKSLKLAYGDCIKYSVLIFDTMKKLLTLVVSPQYLSGPVGIMQMSGAAAQSGLSSLLQLLALIGINLGILNLMPLVITDGGVLSLLLIEAITRKQIPFKVREKLTVVFTVGFLCLAVFVTFADIMRFDTIEKLLK
ncbi:MAG: RIP metalloprotease RseP [Chitinispirillales bacterium]|jgi:regulator of sigma E protease|nr:RIP metalloprotease RseP [Chitinispirillales bacterium]